MKITFINPVHDESSWAEELGKAFDRVCNLHTSFNYGNDFIIKGVLADGQILVRTGSTGCATCGMVAE